MRSTSRRYQALRRSGELAPEPLAAVDAVGPSSVRSDTPGPLRWWALHPPATAAAATAGAATAGAATDARARDAGVLRLLPAFGAIRRYASFTRCAGSA